MATGGERGGRHVADAGAGGRRVAGGGVRGVAEGAFAAGSKVGDIGHALEEGSGSATRFGSEGCFESGGVAPRPLNPRLWSGMPAGWRDGGVGGRHETASHRSD